MTTLDPSNNNNNNEKHIGKAHRDKVINTFPLSKQFLIRTQLKNADALTRDQAVEMLKEFIVQSAQKDEVFKGLIKSGM